MQVRLCLCTSRRCSCRCSCRRAGPGCGRARWAGSRQCAPLSRAGIMSKRAAKRVLVLFDVDGTLTVPRNVGAAAAAAAVGRLNVAP